MNHASYALGQGDSISVEATLTNAGKAPILVFRPSPYSDRLWLDNSGDILARNYSNVSMIGPSARDLVFLAPGESVSARHNLFSRTLDHFLTTGRHKLSGEYDTTRVRLPVPNNGFWKGKIKTPPLVFTVSSENPRSRQVSAPPSRRYSDADGAFVSLANLKQIGLALRKYVHEHGGAYPPMHDPTTVQRVLLRYLKNETAFVQPGTNQLYGVNAKLSGKKTLAMAAPGATSSVVAVYEVKPIEGMRGVIFENGAAQRIPEAMWLHFKKASGIP